MILLNPHTLWRFKNVSLLSFCFRKTLKKKLCNFVKQTYENVSSHKFEIVVREYWILMSIEVTRRVREDEDEKEKEEEGEEEEKDEDKNRLTPNDRCHTVDS